MSLNFWLDKTNRFRVKKIIEKDIEKKMGRKKLISDISSLQRKLRTRKVRFHRLSERGIRRDLMDKYLINGKNLFEWESFFVPCGYLLSANFSPLYKIQGLFKINVGKEVRYIGSADNLGMTLSNFRRTFGKFIPENEWKVAYLKVMPLSEDEDIKYISVLKERFKDYYRPLWNVNQNKGK